MPPPSPASTPGRPPAARPGRRAAADPELARLWDQIDDERLNGQGRLVQLVADRGVLRPELPVEEARDLLWTLSSLAVHDLLVRRCGWSPERYRDWLAAVLSRELLPDPPAAEPAPSGSRRQDSTNRPPRSDND